ncbi:MAG: phosphohistidine phosphatase SixA [Pseudomonadota bacterium]
MKLYLVQHGEAVDKTVDPERPLSEQGEQDVKAMADFLAAAGVRVERVWHSGKRRAEQTAGVLAKPVMKGGDIEAITGINPNDDVTAFAQDADVWEQDTLVVGHLPFMARLVAYLATGKANTATVAFRPGSIVCLEREGNGGWQILWMVRPELLG